MENARYNGGVGGSRGGVVCNGGGGGIGDGGIDVGVACDYLPKVWVQSRESIPGPSFLFPGIREFEKPFPGIKSTTHTNISVNVFSMYFNKSACVLLYPVNRRSQLSQ